MKTLIVYYSRTGTTEALARQLAEKLGADVEPLVDPTPRQGIKGFWSGAVDARKKTLAELPELHHNPAYYDCVLVGTPVWAGDMTPAVRAFLTKFADADAAFGLFATTSMSDLDKTLTSMASLLPDAPKATLGCKRRNVLKDRCQAKIDAFIASLTPTGE